MLKFTLKMPAGIGGEGNADILEEIEKELDVVARYDDQLAMLDKYFLEDVVDINGQFL